MVRLAGCLPRSKEAAGRGLQRRARAESLPRKRVRSEFTRKVGVIEGRKINAHVAFHSVMSGQPRFSG